MWIVAACNLAGAFRMRVVFYDVGKKYNFRVLDEHLVSNIFEDEDY